MTLRTNFKQLIVAVAVCFLLAACTGPMPADDDPDRSGAEEEVEESAELNLAAYEDFDPSAYEEPEPEVDIDLEHDAPEALLEGRADRGTTQTVEGYRIQVFSSQERPEAESVYEDAHNWWEDLEDRPQGLFRDELPVYITYRQPYYRVRIGDFRTRAQAEEALEYLQSRFGDAFISPDTVTITR